MMPNKQAMTEVLLGDVANLSQGIQIDIDNQFTQKNKPNYVRFLRISDFINDNEEPRYIEKPDSKFIVDKNDLSMIRYGSAGAGDLVRGIKGAIANNLFRVIPNEDYILKDYLWFYLSQKKVKHFLFSNSTSSTMPAISFKLVNRLPLIVPPLPEQQKIAQILTTWDKAITTTERLIYSKTQLKKALIQQLLTGKKRLLDDKGIQFKDKFQTTILSNLVEINKSTLGNTTQDNFEFSYISLSDVITGRISKDLESYTYNSAPSRARRVVKTGDILLSTVRPNLKGFAKVDVEHDEYIASTGFAVLSAKKTTNSDYIYHYLFSCHLTGQIHNLVTGSNYPAINSSDVAELKIHYPTLKEQKKIAQVLNNADKEINLLTQQLINLKLEKKALMQQLLTGKIRVNI